MKLKKWLRGLKDSLSYQKEQSKSILKQSWNRGADMADELKKKQKKIKEKKKDD